MTGDDSELILGHYTLPSRLDRLLRNLAMTDTSGDGVSDYDSVNGWPMDVVVKTSGPYAGEPYRWHSYQPLKPDERVETVRFYADALLTDTSGNGIDDYDEKEVLKTDPSVERTYAITLRHQEEIVEELVRQYGGDGSSAQPRFDNIDAAITHLRIGGVESASDLAALELDDSTDDFSFVTNEEGGLVFLGHDYHYWTDTWLSNEEVLAYNEEHEAELDPWDADSDDDGLTDGQEVYGVLWFESDKMVSNKWARPSGVDVSGGFLLFDERIP